MIIKHSYKNSNKIYKSNKNNFLNFINNLQTIKMILNSNSHNYLIKKINKTNILDYLAKIWVLLIKTGYKKILNLM
jgi:hypothetical protein